MRSPRLAAVLAALGGVALAVGLGLQVAHSPALADLRSPALLFGMILLVLAEPARRVRLEDFPRGPAAVLVGLSLLVSLAVLADGGVAFLRQVRAQVNMTPDQKRAAFLEYQVGLRWDEIQAVRRRIPEDGAALLLWNRRGDGYTMQLLVYYLQPRRLHLWRAGARPGKPAAAMPGSAWLRSRGIQYAIEVSGPLGNRVRAWRLEGAP